MNRVTWVVSVISAVFLVLCGSGPVAAGEELPFKGTLETTATIVSFTGGFDATISGGGHATHLGKYQWNSTHTVLFGPPITVNAGILTLTAANGDQLLGTYVGTSQFIGAGLLSFVIQITINSGTGRLAGTSGSLVGTGVVDIADAATPSVATLEGVLNH